MHKPTILVTAAAGKTGAATTLELLRLGYPVRALVRRADARSERLQRAGADVRIGSLEDIADLRAAMAGVRRAYFCPPLESGALRKAVLFAAAARDAKLEAVVALSQWVCDPLHPALHAAEKWLSARVFEWVEGLDVVTVNPGFFADNYMAALEPAAQLGVFAMPLGDGLNAPPSTEDIARVVAAALVDPGPHVGNTYRPTGPRLVSPREIAATFATVLGRPVRYQNAPLALFSKVARSMGYSDYLVAQLHYFLLDYQRGAFGVGAPTTTVLDMTGSPPEDLESIVRRHVVSSPFARRSVVGRIRALFRVVKALLTPAPRLDAIADRLELPRNAHARLASDSPAWRGSHVRREGVALESTSDRLPPPR